MVKLSKRAHGLSFSTELYRREHQVVNGPQSSIRDRTAGTVTAELKLSGLERLCKYSSVLNLTGDTRTKLKRGNEN